MSRVERLMAMGTQRAMAGNIGNNNNDDHDNNDNTDNNDDQGDSVNEDKNTDNADNNDDNENDVDNNEDKDIAELAVCGFISSGRVSGRDCGGVGGNSFGGWQVVMKWV